MLADLGDAAGGLAALRRALALNRELPEAWRTLGDTLFREGDVAGADTAYAEFARTSVTDPALRRAADALFEDRPAAAEDLLRAHLGERPTDVAAMRLMAEAYERAGPSRRRRDAARARARARPGPCRRAPALCRGAVPPAEGRLRRSPQLKPLLAAEPRNPAYLNLMAASLGLLGEEDRSVAIYEQLLADYPRQPKVWLNYAQALRTLGRHEDGRRRLPPLDRAGPRPGRRLLGPGQPQGRPAHARRGGGDRAGAARPPARPRSRSSCTTRSARRSRTAATMPPRSSTMPPAPRSAAARAATTPMRRPRSSSGRRRCSRRTFFAARGGQGCRVGRADLHRRPAALRLDAGRADPGQPPGRRGHHGAARHRPDRRRACAPSRAATPRRWRRSTRTGSRALGESYSPRPRRTGACPGRSSPTRCRTTSSTSA